MSTNAMRFTSTLLLSLLLAASTGCGGDDASTVSAQSTTDGAAVTTTDGAVLTSDSTAASAPGSGAPTSTTVGATPGPGGNGPVTDPCELLTAAIAASVLGVEVGDPTVVPGEGNQTCSYRPVDATTQGFVLLTTYSAAGSEAVLDEAATQFPGATPVDGVGDAAQVSVGSGVIGVLTGSTVFALGIFLQSTDGQVVPVSEEQLIAAARAVLDGR